MRKLTLTAVVLGLTASVAVGEVADPYLWLEEIEGDKALAWVRAQNDRSLKILQTDERYEDLQTKALTILEAKDRIAYPSFRGDGITNFWRDDANVRGVERRTTVESYLSGSPEWETVLDIDALARAENANWVYTGQNCLEPEETFCLVGLSDGGKDAVEIREFNSKTKKFVDGGFRLPDGKQDVTWLDADTLLVGRDWGPNTMTDSGYPYIIKTWRRGTRLEDAPEVYRGKRTDVWARAYKLTDVDGVMQAVMFIRYLSRWETEYCLATDDGPRRMPFPLRSSVRGYRDQVIVRLDEDWTWNGIAVTKGTLLSFDLSALKRDPASAEATVILAPGARQSIQTVASTRNRLLVPVYENVKGALYSFAFADGKWTRSVMDLPSKTSIGVVSTRDDDDKVFVSVTGFREPDALYFGDAVTGKFHKVASLPPRFDASSLTVDQFEAISTDGEKIPYFVVRRKNVEFGGQNPTLLHAYGGFKVSMIPRYDATLGRLWLERGGIYVLANIRGGGEFGPAWHEAGLKTKRQIVFDDFASVARDLITRKVTTPRRLGIEGGSNGGLLMGVEFTQHPELWNAVVIQVPLLDMLRFNKLGVGASWQGEYGDPSDPIEGAFLRKISPYHNLREGVRYPEPFFMTSTKDDRVHPGHARKMAAKMEAMNLPFLYYENIDGGHAAAANLREEARQAALEFTYLTRKLID